MYARRKVAKTEQEKSTQISGEQAKYQGTTQAKKKSIKGLHKSVRK